MLWAQSTTEDYIRAEEDEEEEEEEDKKKERSPLNWHLTPGQPCKMYNFNALPTPYLSSVRKKCNWKQVELLRP